MKLIAEEGENTLYLLLGPDARHTTLSLPLQDTKPTKNQFYWERKHSVQYPDI